MFTVTECSRVTDNSFRFLYSPFMTEGLHRFYGGNDLHFLPFSCYRRRVPHPSALFAEGWDSTVAALSGFSRAT
jgi:hypothetical protein